MIVNNNLHIGGVQKALINLLWNIRGRYDVTLLLFYPAGECMAQIPPEVKVISADSDYRYLGMSGKDAQSVKDRLMRSIYAAITRLFGRKYAIFLMGFGQKQLEGYDAAVSYMHNSGEKVFYGGCNDFVLKHVAAKRKVTFLHCDYALSGADTPDNNRMYAGFDTIAACSEGCADTFRKVNPHLADRVLVVPNCHRFDQIRELAGAAPVNLCPDKINIVTVSRLGKEKSVERGLQAIARLGELKERIHYYIIGDGSEKTALLQTMEKENLWNCVTLCGQLENPYGYMQAADLLLIPSRSEAAPLVIGEAACLGTPVLSMKTSSAIEMIEQTGFGWVCENKEASMAASLEQLIRNPKLLSDTSEDLKQRDFQNDAAIALFATCIDGTV